jgi:AcrR family transcriptional regulator
MSGGIRTTSGSRRLAGRPRDATLDHQILEVVRVLLAERGYQGLSVQEVTRRCGVHVATIGRRWPSKAGLVAAAILRDDEPFLADDSALSMPTGDLREDLRCMVIGIRSFLADPAVRAALPGLWSEVHHDPSVLNRVQRRREQWSTLVHDVLNAAIASGDAPSGVLMRAELLTDVLAGTSFASQALGHRVLDDSAVSSLIDLVLNGLLSN